MPQWIVDLVGESLAPIAWVTIVAIAVCLLAMLMIVMAKKVFGGRIGTGYKASAPRLAVMDVARIDEKRRLILVRRDEVEHLVLVGGQNDVLLEGNILRARAASGARREAPGDDVPEFRDDFSPPSSTSPDAGPVPASDAKPAEPRPQASRQETGARPPSPQGDTGPTPLPPAPPVSVQTAQSKEPANGAKPIPAVTADFSMSPSERGVPPRSIASPSLNLRQSRSTPQPRTGSPTGDTNTPLAATPLAAGSDSGRREPSPAVPPTVPEVQPEPAASNPERPRADLRAQMNRAQSPALDRVQDATAPAIAVDAADRRDPPRQPLSVRSFASAIQNRKAPPEMPQPNPRAASAPAPSADAKPSQSGPDQRDRQPSATQIAGSRATPPHQTEATPGKPTTPDAEPSLEDFLSAEIDADFGNDAFFAKELSDADRSKDAPREAPPIAGTRSQATPSAAAESRRNFTAAPPASPAASAPPRPADQPEPATRSAAAPVPLTLEEEMERLLGDFNFGDDSDHKAN